VFSSCRGTNILQLEEVFLQEIHNIPQPSFPKASCPTCLSLSICSPNPSINIHQPKWPRHSQQIHEISPWDFMAIAKTRNLMILGIAIGFSMWESQSHKPTIWEWRMALGLPHYKAPPNDKFIYKPHLIIVNKNYIFISFSIMVYHNRNPTSPSCFFHPVTYTNHGSPIQTI